MREIIIKISRLNIDKYEAFSVYDSFDLYLDLDLLFKCQNEMVNTQIQTTDRDVYLADLFVTFTARVPVRRFIYS